MRAHAKELSKIQEEMIKADEDDDPTWINVGLSERKNLSKSTTMMPDLKKHPKLLDDT